MNRKKILLGQLAAKGDCLYATAIARQIKNDYPGCHLTWAIGSMARSILDNNPYVDEIWEIPIANHFEVDAAWNRFESEAEKRKSNGEFDEVFFTQISPNNFQNFDGTVRSSIFRCYQRIITVPVEPVLDLTVREIENGDRFASVHKLAGKNQVVLFECSHKSGQSFVTPRFAIEVSRKLLEKFDNSCVILSSDAPITCEDSNIIDGSVISFRENAGLTKYCTLFIGCSSGISWLCTSTAAKKLPMIQLLKKSQSVFASMVHDHRYFGLSTDMIIEMTECNASQVAACVSSIFTHGFASAKERYHEAIPLKFGFYASMMSDVLGRKNLKTVLASLRHTVKRYGFHPNLVYSVFVMLPYYFFRNKLYKLLVAQERRS